MDELLPVLTIHFFFFALNDTTLDRIAGRCGKFCRIE